ncbi:MAG: response regulator transcription factor [Clostridiales bacterium]|nr:response regulator transcription factor [Clostridiales bacterium]
MLKIAICDDDKEICFQIEEHILKCTEDKKLKVQIDKFYSGKSLLEKMREENSYKLIFLDIKIDNENGSDLGYEIRMALKNNSVNIIYISSYTKYAMSLFRSRPLDFIIKPITYEKINKVFNILEEIGYNDEIFFEVKNGKNIKKILYTNILYFMGKGRKIIIATVDKDYECYMKLNDVNVPNNFMQVHKSYIVNCKYIDEYRYDEIILTHNIRIPISRTYQKEIRKKYKSII